MLRPLVSLLAAFCVLLLGMPGLTQVSSAAPLVAPPGMPRSQAEQTSEITSVDFSPNGQMFVAGSADSRVLLWQTASGKLERELAAHRGLPVTGVAFSPDGKTVASAGRDSVVRLWDAATGEEIRSLHGHAQAVTALAFSPDGRTLVSAGEDTRVLVWDVATGKLRSVLSGHKDFVTSVAVSNDGTVVATGSRDDSVKLWNVASGRETATLHGHSDDVTDVALSPDGRTVASAGADGAVRLWDVAEKRQLRELRGEAQRVESLAFSPDGTTLATGGDNGQVTLWNLTAARSPSRTLERHNAPVKAVAFSRDGRKVLSGGADAQVVVWDEARAQPDLAVPAPAASAESVGPPAARQAATAEMGIAATASSITEGPGGPILVVTSTANRFSEYYAEILRNEGLNAFAVTDVGALSAGMLNGYDVVLLAETALTDQQAALLSDWVNAGGNLIAMRPDKRLAGLLGLSDAGGTIREGYLLIDTSKAPGAGLVGETIQFHGTADRYTLNGATAVATLYADADTPTANPAVTINQVGASGGQATAFTFDLARSVVYTRQGNVAWESQERDGFPPRRSDDMYFGNASFDPREDWVDLDKVSIPQADEQQRLLVNLILEMNKDKKPLPRFWYLPRGLKVAVLMASDDHGNGGTAGRFDDFIAMSEPGCSVEDWECIRASSYIYTSSLTDAQVQYYVSQGFEIGIHVDTFCADWSPSQLASFYASQIADFRTVLPSMPAPKTERTHCIVWSDWVNQPKVQLSHGIRLDTNYYYWPPSWVLDRPGYFTGSGMPMRFADLDGSLIDVYQATTQLTDESGQSYPASIDSLLDKALGPEGYYGVITVNAHTDSPYSEVADAVVASATARDVPIVSAEQMLTWLDGRNSSSFASITWNGNTLSFTINPGEGARGLRAMLPTSSAGGQLLSLSLEGEPVPYSVEAMKGIEYALFPASAGSYVAVYGTDLEQASVIGTFPADGATDVALNATVTATFDEPLDPASVNGNSFELRDAANQIVPGTVSYDPATYTAKLQPEGNLAPAATYTAIIKGGAAGVKDLAGNPMESDVTWTFTTAQGPTCPCSIWDGSAIPTTLSANDPNAVELGVKFRAELDGFITGLRFYKGSQNTGTHTASLWTSSGQLMARATFQNETSSGWQQVNFDNPVPIAAGTVYVASYHAPNGRYSVDTAYFVAGRANPPLYALADGEQGGNGVFAYSGEPTFPTNSFMGSNYWVDIVFDTGSAPVDTTPPAVSQIAPPAGATEVSPATSITATFSEPLDPASVSTNTYLLVDGSGNPVAGSVAYDDASRTASFQPTADLAPNTTYTATLKGGDAGVKDLAGNPLANDFSWSFTTSQQADTTPPGQPTGLTATPSTSAISLDWNDNSEPDLAGYNVYRALSPSGPFSRLNPSPLGESQYTDTTAPTGSTSYYQVTAIDTSGNESAPATTQATRPGAVTSHTLWPDSATPALVHDPDSVPVELGVKFRAEVDGFVTALRFYKGNQNTGAHTGSLWTSNGQLLARVTFQNETSSGWQQVDFPSPVPITAGTVYVASYHAPNGRYSLNENYFTTGHSASPLYALASGEQGGNGVYAYSASPTFPNNTYGASNYWVDVVFVTGAPTDTTPPTVTQTAPPAGATQVDVGTSVTATFSEPLDPATVNGGTLWLADGAGTTVSATVAYDEATRTATLTPSSPLAPGATYTATIKGGDAGVKDLAGNPLANDFTWSFTTAQQPDTTPPSQPTGLTASPSTSAISLDWNDNSEPDLAGYNVYRASNPSGPFSKLNPSPLSESQYNDTTAPTGSTSYYQVTAVDTSGNESDPASIQATRPGEPGGPSFSLWPDSTVPAILHDPDTAATEVGLRFRADTDGFITGLRFYKGPQNTGTHTGSLWTSNGQLLARATFQNETPSGWQQVTFESPVPITAGTVYVASYHAPNGRYSVSEWYFETQGHSAPPLYALRDGEQGGNGLYAYSASPTFPSNTYGGSNYWVDVVFQPAD